MVKPFLSILLLLLLVCPVSYARQGFSTDTIIPPQKILKFIPKGYTVMDMVKGDLNLDKLPDAILVLKAIGEDTAPGDADYKRPLLLLSGRADKTFTLASRNDNIIYCHQCGGLFSEPYTGAAIKKGSFTVHHFGGTNNRWSNDITFRYSRKDKNWYLYKIVDNGWSVAHPDHIDSIVRTKRNFGTVSFKNYSADMN